MKQFVAAMVGLLLSPSARALACAVCYGDPDSAQVKGAEAGILVLFGVIATVLAGIAGMAIFWILRARAMASTTNAVAFPGRTESGFADAD